MKPIASLEYLFPKKLFKVDNLFLDHLECFKEVSLDIINTSGSSRSEEFQVNTTNQFNNKVLEDSRLQILRDEILNYSKEFMTLLNYDSYYIKNCKCVDSILNVSNGGDYLFPHTHGICLLAGVFYIAAPAESKIWFYDDLQKIERSYMDEIPSTASMSKSYDCTPGSLIIFPPDFIHANKSQPVGEKIAISFKINY